MKHIDVPASFWGTPVSTKFAPTLDEFFRAFPALNQPGGPIFAADNVIVFDHHAGFLTDPKFVAATLKAALTADVDKMIAARRHWDCWAAQTSARIPGDFVDCGCYDGKSVEVVLNYVGWPLAGKRAYLYDAFTYDIEPSAPGGSSKDAYTRTLQRFAPYPNVSIVRGTLPEAIQRDPERVAYLHIDLGLAEPTLATLEALYPRVSDGGVILIESYGIAYAQYRHVKAAVDGFCAKHNHAVGEMWTGQGLIVKR